jgi:hypothetical protein
MAESNTAPNPSFNGIDFNPSFFNTSTALTLSQADSLYLNKTVPDTANVYETFTAGITANSIQCSTIQASTLISTDTIDSIGLSLTLGGGSTTNINASKNITLQATTLPTVGQLGYTNNLLNGVTGTTSSTASTVTNIAGLDIPAGTYLVHFGGQGSAAGVYNIGLSTSFAFDTKYTIGATNAAGYNQNYTHPAMTVIIQNTTTTSWYLNHSSTTASYPVLRIYWYYTRIA